MHGALKICGLGEKVENVRETCRTTTHVIEAARGPGASPPPSIPRLESILSQDNLGETTGLKYEPAS